MLYNYNLEEVFSQYDINRYVTNRFKYLITYWFVTRCEKVKANRSVCHMSTCRMEVKPTVLS